MTKRNRRNVVDARWAKKETQGRVVKDEDDGIDVMASLCLYYDSVNVYESLRPACIQHWHNMIKVNSAAVYKKLAKDIIMSMFWDVACESLEHDRDIYSAIFNQSLNYCIPF